MAEEELKQLRAKLQQQQRQFQNYREECKNLENFLEGETNKKQSEVRKLKEEAINKDKMFKALKLQNSSLITDINNLKAQLAKANINDKKDEENVKRLDLMSKDNLQLTERVQQLNKNIEKLNSQKTERQKCLLVSQQKINKLQKEIQAKDTKLNELNNKFIQYQSNIKNLNSKIQQLQSKKIKFEDLPTSKKQINQQKIITAKKTKRRQDSQCADQRIKKYEEKILRYERQIKELKAKLAEKIIISPQKLNLQEQISLGKGSKPYVACQVITKQYYLSPIVEVNQQNKYIKLFKSARNGCFDKSLGATKHKFDTVSYEINSIIKEITEKIMKSEIELNHSILIYGIKKSNKKQIMGSIVTKLFNFLKNKIEAEASQDLQAVFLKRISDDQNGLVKQIGYNSDEILDILEKVSNIVNSQGKKSQKSSPKKNEKPRVCYFSLHIGQFSIEIGTSSFTNIPYRQKQVLSTFYNNVMYSKLPNILQPTYCQRFIILTLNPIIDLYDDCKNTLSVTQYKGLFSLDKDIDNQWQGINKQMLNDLVKKKIDHYEREIEQNLLKIKKVEVQCLYFKSKFDELQNWLKNLLSTHHGQNSYLKKSPILLSYEKMLKFVHGVQAKSSIPLDNICSTMRINAIDFDFNDSDDPDEAL